MAKIVTAPTGPLEQPSPWAEDWLDVVQVLEAAQRGLSDEELLESLGTLAAVRYAAALRAMPHQVMQPVSRLYVVPDRASLPQDVQPSLEIQAARYWHLSGGRRCAFRDQDLFLAQVEELVRSGG